MGMFIARKIYCALGIPPTQDKLAHKGLSGVEAGLLRYLTENPTELMVMGRKLRFPHKQLQKQMFDSYLMTERTFIKEFDLYNNFKRVLNTDGSGFLTGSTSPLIIDDRKPVFKVSLKEFLTIDMKSTLKLKD